MRRSGGALFALFVLVGLVVACGGGQTEEAAETANIEWVAVDPEAEEGPWKYAELGWTVEDLQAAYTVGTKMAYDRVGMMADGSETRGAHTMEVVEATDLVVGLKSNWEDDLRKGGSTPTVEWAHAVLIQSHPSSDDTEFAIVGNEQVETPAGTFDTVVVEVSNSFFGTKETYWLVADQPGVYAKWVDYGKDDDEQEIVMILQEITRPES